MSQDQAMFTAHAFRRARELSNIDIWKFDPPAVGEAILTSVVIHLKDGLQTLNALGHRISLDGEAVDDDVTKRVTDFRNASCHIGSPSRIVKDMNRLSFGVAVGACQLGQINGIDLENPHNDDVAYFIGALRLFHIRDIRTSIALGRAKLAELAAAEGWFLPPA